MGIHRQLMLRIRGRNERQRCLERFSVQADKSRQRRMDYSRGWSAAPQGASETHGRVGKWFGTASAVAGTFQGKNHNAPISPPCILMHYSLPLYAIKQQKSVLPMIYESANLRVSRSTNNSNCSQDRIKGAIFWCFTAPCWLFMAVNLISV